MLNYSRNPLIQTLVIRIGLAVQVHILVLNFYYIFLSRKFFPHLSNTYKELCIVLYEPK